MQAKELFSAAVRVIGLLSIGRGLYDLVYVVAYEAGSGDFSVTAKFPGFDLLIGIFYSLLGLYLLRGAPLIVDYAFPVRSAYLDRLVPEDDSMKEDDISADEDPG